MSWPETVWELFWVWLGVLAGCWKGGTSSGEDSGGGKSSSEKRSWELSQTLFTAGASGSSNCFFFLDLLGLAGEAETVELSTTLFSLAVSGSFLLPLGPPPPLFLFVLSLLASSSSGSLPAALALLFGLVEVNFRGRDIRLRFRTPRPKNCGGGSWLVELRHGSLRGLMS